MLLSFSRPAGKSHVRIGGTRLSLTDHLLSSLRAAAEFSSAQVRQLALAGSRARSWAAVAAALGEPPPRLLAAGRARRAARRSRTATSSRCRDSRDCRGSASISAWTSALVAALMPLGAVPAAVGAPGASAIQAWRFARSTFSAGIVPAAAVRLLHASQRARRRCEARRRGLAAAPCRSRRDCPRHSRLREASAGLAGSMPRRRSVSVLVARPGLPRVGPPVAADSLK